MPGAGATLASTVSVGGYAEFTTVAACTAITRDKSACVEDF
jgi:hypothetical protein